MSYHSPAGWHERCAIRNDNAAHQIRLDFVGSHSGHLKTLAVSCTCRPTGQVNGTGPNCHPIKTGIRTADEAWTEWWAYHDALEQVQP